VGQFENSVFISWFYIYATYSLVGLNHFHAFFRNYIYVFLIAQNPLIYLNGHNFSFIIIVSDMGQKVML